MAQPHGHRHWVGGAPQEVWGGRPSAHRPPSTRRWSTPRCACRAPLWGRMSRSQHGRGVWRRHARTMSLL